MRVSDFVQCADFPCLDVNHTSYAVPAIDLRPEDISIVLISEAAPADPADGYYAGFDSLFARTTTLAFQDAGAQVKDLQDILALGVYLTSAVKCSKTEYGIITDTVVRCSSLLEQELALFPNAKVYLLMGDVAIRAINTIAKRAGEKRPIPAAPTYKIRDQVFTYQGKRLFPSYLQAGPSFFIEKSKRKMIAQDIAAALSLVKV